MEITEDNLCGLEGDSNALILPAKKKKNGKKGGGKEREKVQPKLSKSKQRKLKKLEEEKERAAMLAKSIETLEKYKIPEDAFTLLQSSTNISRVETVREKRRRAIQFSKAGLEVMDSGLPSKRCRGSCPPEGETDLEEAKSTDDIIDNNYSHPVAAEEEKPLSSPLPTEKEPVSGNGFGLSGGYVSTFSEKEITGEANQAFAEECTGNPLLSSCRPDTRESSELVARSDESRNDDYGMARDSSDRVPNELLTAPLVVHVTRPADVENQRKDLPIVMMEQEIMEAINEHSIVIICGETGCGKTTQVPQFLYEAGYGSNLSPLRSGMIGVTQPRRVAVLATAERVAKELGFQYGKEVGYKVRYDQNLSKDCSIKFMTDGILLREVQSDILLRRYSVLILDEAHERTVDTDILIGMLSRVVQLRQKIYVDQKQLLHSGKEVNPEDRIYPLKLVLMSATLRVEDFISGRRLFTNPPPVIEIPARQFPVTPHFSKRTEIVDYIGQAYKKVLSIHRRLPPGGILVFVTGQREVEYLCQKLHKASREFAKNAERNAGDEVTSTSETNLLEVIMKDNSEKCDTEEHNYEELSDLNEEVSDFSEDESSDMSYDSESESEIEIKGDDVNSQDDHNPLADVDHVRNSAGNGESLASSKATFEALAGKTISNSGFDVKLIHSAPEECVGHPNHGSFKTDGGKNRSVGTLRVLPLYAMLPKEKQLRVFDKVEEGERLVVVATNVAETSLTIPGIKYVVDTGREKTKNYNLSNGMETYEIQWISKASAAQRKGRAGRTGPGHCYHLYSSAVFSNILSDFSCAEITKKPVDNIVLILKSMKIDKVENFPFPTPPEKTALIEAEHCLKTLGALDGEGKITPLGKVMARYPMSPRHSRMLLTVIQMIRKVENNSRATLVLAYAIAVAAALSMSDPFLQQLEEGHNDSNNNTIREKGEKNLENQEKLRKKKLKEAAKQARRRFSHPTSDSLTVAYVLHCFELSSSPDEFCRENTLIRKVMEEMSKLRKQLLRLIFQNLDYSLEQQYSWNHGNIKDVEQAWKVPASKCPLLLNEEELLSQAICAGWVDRVARRIRGNSGLSEGDRKVTTARYQACMVKETVFLSRSSSLSNAAPEFVVYNELLQKKRPYMNGVTAVKSEWLVKYAGSSCTFSTVEDPKPFYDPQSDQVFCWSAPTFGPHLWQLPLHSLPISDDKERVKVFAFAFLEGQILPCLKLVREFMAARPGIILDRQAQGERRVGSLLHKLEERSVDNCSKLRELWSQNPRELHSEILDWFKKGFHGQFDKLWLRMQTEVHLQPEERFQMKKTKTRKKKKKRSSVSLE